MDPAGFEALLCPGEFVYRDLKTLEMALSGRLPSVLGSGTILSSFQHFMPANN